MKTEFSALKELDHPNIVKLYDIAETGVYKSKDDSIKTGMLFSVLEFVQNGEIFDYVALAKFGERFARYFFKQLLGALGHCHAKGFAHRDLKPENLLLDDQYNLKLADFGFATLLGGKAYCGWLKTYLGTQGYMAPEILSKAGQYYGIPTDIFAAGVILYIMVTGKPPWTKASPQNFNYNKFCTNQHLDFWKDQRKHIRKNDPQFDFSKSFIS